MKKVSGDVSVSPRARGWRRSWRSTSRAEVPPGRDGQGVRRVQAVPRRRGDPAGRARAAARTCREGNYQLVISDWTRYMQDEQTSKPFRFTAENVDERVRRAEGLHGDPARTRSTSAWSARPTASRSGGRRCRSCRRRAGRCCSAPAGATRRAFVSSTTQDGPDGHVMQGAAEFVITIDDDAKVESATGKPARGRATPRRRRPSTPRRRRRSRAARAADDARAEPEPDVRTPMERVPSYRAPMSRCRTTS